MPYCPISDADAADRFAPCYDALTGPSVARSLARAPRGTHKVRRLGALEESGRRPRGERPRVVASDGG